MNTQAQRRVSWFGIAAALPAVGCVAFLVYAAIELDREALAALFTAAGAAMLYGAAKIR